MVDKHTTDTCADAMKTVLNKVDASIYVADMETHELLFLNERASELLALNESWHGKRCWEVLQKGQTSPCSFCTNSQLLNSEGQPNPVHIWEFQNTVNQHWYQCRDQAIPWEGGRLVRLEIATDITARKLIEQELQQAKELAEHLADTDALTGLKNRRAFFKFAVHLLHSSLRFKQPATLVMFDLDWFKKINDEYGHMAGDAVLQEVSNLAESSIREADVLARVGGEEFALLLPQTGAEQARTLIERLRQSIASAVFNFDERQLSCTASFGITSTSEFANIRSSKQLLDAMVSQADTYLYEAKNKGRNTVIIGQCLSG